MAGLVEDDPLVSDEWASVFPGYGGEYLVCPLCAAMVPEDISLGTKPGGAGRLVHIAWHLKLRRLLDTSGENPYV